MVKSYLNDESDKLFKKKGQGWNGGSRSGASRSGGDPDLDAAFEELDDFLNDGNGKRKGAGEAKKKPEGKQLRKVPAELLADFAELGLSPDASAEECKATYKKLLKIHHPDRHAGKAEAMKKATGKTARVNAAWERIEKWLKN